MRRAHLARIFGANVLEHEQRRRNIFELLAHLLADLLALGAAVGAEAILGRHVVHDLLARQVRWQPLAAVSLPIRLWRCRWRYRLRGFRLGQDLLGGPPKLGGLNPLP